MAVIPKKVQERIRSAVKAFQPTLQAQRDRDVSEADTVTLVKDLFADLLGFDKYLELTSEHQVRGTYCDLAVKIESKLRLLVEVKAIGLALNERHVKQAVDYAANQGLDFVVLTNAIHWRLFQVMFKKPVEAKLLAEFDLLALNLRDEDASEPIYLLTREGMLKGAIKEFTEKKEATSRYLLASLLVGDGDVLSVVRRELRRITGHLVAPETIAQVLKQEVIKRDALEGAAAAEADRMVRRADAARAESKHADGPASDASSKPDAAPPQS